MAEVNIIRLLFEMGLKQREMVALLNNMELNISERQLRRILARNRLWRRKEYSESGVVTDFIRMQLQTSGKLHGYRWMHEKMRNNGIRVRKEDVRKILKIMDPEGCLFR